MRVKGILVGRTYNNDHVNISYNAVITIIIVIIIIIIVVVIALLALLVPLMRKRVLGWIGSEEMHPLKLKGFEHWMASVSASRSAA